MHRLVETRRLIGLFALAFVVSFAGCGRSESSGQAEADVEEPEISIQMDDPWLQIQHMGQWTGDLDGMIERGFVRLLVIHSKTFYFFDGARERGVTAEFRSAFEQFLNRKFKDRKKTIKVVAIPVQRDQLIPYLLEGYGDIGTGNWTVTAEREKLVDFTNSTVANVRELIITAPDQPDLDSVEDLSGREVHVRRSSSYFESLLALNERFRKEKRPPVKIRAADECLEDEDLAEMVNASLLPATAMDSHKWEPLWSRIYTEAKFNPEVFIRDEGEVASMIRKNSPQLMALLNEFLKSRGMGTAFMNTVLRRYRNNRWILNAAATSERKRYDAVIDYFRKYGGKYDFDYLMLAAQGYQESRLDQSARSGAGAVGIMQLLPKTAAGPPIRISNIQQAESNIHAGTKYMRYIADNYFDIPEMDDVNRLLFSFAAYNAGPNRISRLRKLAPEYGFDPNKWFNNVEFIVERKVGKEPVRYVGNIYKYYVAYRRLREMEEQGQGENQGQ
jgi:membrane-bound lytic murein transglycosylase MltF